MSKYIETVEEVQELDWELPMYLLSEDEEADDFMDKTLKAFEEFNNVVLWGEAKKLFLELDYFYTAK